MRYSISLTDERPKMTENIDLHTKQHLYEIVHLENAINAAGWEIIRIGLLQRYLCHATTGKIIYKSYEQPINDRDDLIELLIAIQDLPWELR